MAENIDRGIHTFHNGSTTPGNGNVLAVSDLSSLVNIEFVTEGSFSAVVKARIVSGKWYEWPVYQLPGYDQILTSIADHTKAYQVELKGIKELKVELLSVTGAVTVYGKVVG